MSTYLEKTNCYECKMFLLVNIYYYYCYEIKGHIIATMGLTADDNENRIRNKGGRGNCFLTYQLWLSEGVTVLQPLVGTDVNPVV